MTTGRSARPDDAAEHAGGAGGFTGPCVSMVTRRSPVGTEIPIALGIRSDIARIRTRGHRDQARRRQDVSDV